MNSQVYGRREMRVINKWEQPILWAVLGDSSGTTQSWLETSLRQYEQHVGIPFRKARVGETANYIIAFVPSKPPEVVSSYLAEQKQRFLRNGVVLNHLISSGIDAKSYEGYLRTRYEYPAPNPSDRKTYCFVLPYLSHGASIIFISENFPRLRRCISEETLQALGLYYDTSKSWSSIMSITRDGYLSNARHDASYYDLLYLRVLYDPRLRSGMTRDEARPLVKEIFTEMRPDETKPPQN